MMRLNKLKMAGFSHYLLLGAIVLVVGVGGAYAYIESNADAKTNTASNINISNVATVTKSPIYVKLYKTNDCITDLKGIVKGGNPIYLEKCNGARDQRFSFLPGQYMTYGYNSKNILLCVGNANKKGKAELLNCDSTNAVLKFVNVAKGAGGMKFPGGFLDAPKLGQQMTFKNNSKVNGRQDFIGSYNGKA